MTAAIGVAALLAAGSATVLLRRDRVAARDALPRIAVLPFDLLGAPDDEFFAEGLTEEITSRLAQLSGLRVVSRTSALRFRQSDRDAKEIGRELNVHYLLEGTVRLDRPTAGPALVRVTPQLIRTADDVHLWTERYDASLVPGEVFRVQGAIAERVAGVLDVTMLDRDRRALATSTTRNQQAFTEYLLGRFHLRKLTRDGIRLAVEYLTRAVAADSTFARAHAALAEAYYRTVVYLQGAVSVADMYATGERAARRAIALDPTLAEGHLYVALIRWAGAWDWEEARRAFDRALELDPDLAGAHKEYALYLRARGRLRDAEEHARRAVALDPLSVDAHNSLAPCFGSRAAWKKRVPSTRERWSCRPTSGRHS